MNEDCSRQSCDVPKNAVQDYLNQYSLNQVVVTNSEFVAVINGVTITIPAGTFSYPITSGTSTFSNISFQGCQSLISIPVPPGSSFAQIQALVQSMLNQAAQQQAECNAQSARPSPPAVFLNQQVSFTPSCDPFLMQGTVPRYITRNGNSVVLSAGIFSSSISQEDANKRATDSLANLINSQIADFVSYCGCADSNIVSSLSSSFVIPNDGSTVVLNVPDSSVILVNPAQNELTGAWYWAGLLNNVAGGMRFSVDSIVDPTHVIARSKSSLSPGDTISAGASIVRATQPQIPTTQPIPSSARILSLSQLQANFSIFTGCPKSTVNPWNGTFNFRDFHASLGLYTNIRYELFGLSYSLGGIELDSLNHNSVALDYNGRVGGFWAIAIYCSGGGIIWSGTKYSGSTPSGIYYSEHSSGTLYPPCIFVD